MPTTQKFYKGQLVKFERYDIVFKITAANHPDYYLEDINDKTVGLTTTADNLTPLTITPSLMEAKIKERGRPKFKVGQKVLVREEGLILDHNEEDNLYRVEYLEVDDWLFKESVLEAIPETAEPEKTELELAEEELEKATEALFNLSLSVDDGSMQRKLDRYYTARARVEELKNK